MTVDCWYSLRREMADNFIFRRVLKWNSAYPFDINITKLLIGLCSLFELCIMVLSFALGVKGQVELVLVQGLSCFATMLIGCWLYYEPSYNHYKMLLILEPFTVVSAIVCFVYSRQWRLASVQLCDDVYSLSPPDYFQYCDTLIRARNSFYDLLIVSIVLRGLCEIACGVGTRKHRILMLETQRIQRERREQREKQKALKSERERRQKLQDRHELKKKVRRDQASYPKSDAPLL